VDWSPSSEAALRWAIQGEQTGANVLLKETDLTADEFRFLVGLGEQARLEKHRGMR
jgi:hypothetical protein